MTISYEAKIVREGDSFFFDFPLIDSLEVAQQKVSQWICDNESKIEGEVSFYIRQSDGFIKVTH